MNTSRTTAPPLHLQKNNGFSLIEVLVTTLLISTGVLGMAALQGRAIAYSHETLQRTTAAMLANDLLELVRATPEAWSRYLQSASYPPAASAPCPATPSQPAAQLACWRGEVAALLPGATALAADETHVCRSPAPGTCAANGSAVEVQVAWQTAHSGCSPCLLRLRSEL